MVYCVSVYCMMLLLLHFMCVYLFSDRDAAMSSSADPARREGGRPCLGELRSHLTCVLCAGYFIDATTIVECLHTCE